MFGHKREEAVSVYVYELTPDEQDRLNESTETSGNHCAWCGDPPDAFGSHGICTFHAAQMVEQAAARRRGRGH